MSREVQDYDYGFKIPPGYEKLSDERAGTIKDYMLDPSEVNEIQSKIRILGGRVMFLFDRNNPEYNEFLAKCKEATKALSLALNTEMEKRKIPVYVKRNQKLIPGKRTMSFLIRPPFFSSLVAKKESKHRLQPNDDKNCFIFHVDEDGLIQYLRYFGQEDEHMIYEDEERPPLIVFRENIANEIRLSRDLLSGEYGNWGNFAKILGDAIEKNIPTLGVNI